MTLPIRIILHGLIALVPQTDASGPKMMALLVDGHSKPPEMTCFAEHLPRIKFPTTAQQCTQSDDCVVDQPGTCLCKLNRHEISILPQTAQIADKPLERTPRRNLPFDPNEAASFANVANISQMGYTLDPAFRPGPKAPPATLAARFVFPFKMAASCGLATRRDDLADYVHPLNMRPLEKEEASGEMSQAMAMQVEVTTTVDVDLSAKQAPILRLSPFPGEAGDTFDFPLPADLSEIQIKVSNDREHFMTPDKTCDDGIGRDFAFFYELVDVQKRPNWLDRPIPHAKYSVAKSSSDLVLDPTSNLCLSKGKAAMSRPICVMASLNSN
jgi:hypothetical protein